jgi:Activator of Hsp90 ATPase homolog 1-like protein
MDNFNVRPITTKVEDSFTEISIEFHGLPVAGMLSWLEEVQIKKWWQLEEVRIDPEVGGLFYLRWLKKDTGVTHVIFGSIEVIDTENNFFKIAKVIYIFGEAKMQGLSITVSFLPHLDTISLLSVKIEHPYGIDSRKYFDEIVHKSWPASLQLFSNFMYEHRN